jgi:hypothetical protein
MAEVLTFSYKNIIQQQGKIEAEVILIPCLRKCFGRYALLVTLLKNEEFIWQPPFSFHFHFAFFML